MSTPKKETTEKTSQFGFGLTFKSANPADYPVTYQDDVWDVVQPDSNLNTVMGEPGQYDQHTINEELARFSIEQMDKLGDYVKLEDLQDGITFDDLNANSLKVDGKDVSLVGHQHVVEDITDLKGLWSIPGAEDAATTAT